LDREFNFKNYSQSSGTFFFLENNFIINAGSLIIKYTINVNTNGCAIPGTPKAPPLGSAIKCSTGWDIHCLKCIPIAKNKKIPIYIINSFFTLDLFSINLITKYYQKITENKKGSPKGEPFKIDLRV